MKTVLIAGALACSLMAVTAPAAFAAQATNCTVTGVAAFDNRVHVRCAEKPPGAPVSASDLMAGGNSAFYYAVELNSPLAARMSDIALWALTGHRAVTVWFEPATSANPPGCAANDCRRLTGIAAQ